MIIDTHAHYDDEMFAKDLDAVLSESREAGVRYIVNAATDFASLDKVLALTARYDMVYTALGLHPEHAMEACNRTGKAAESDGMAKEETAEILSRRITPMVAKEKVVAVGEIGLDYHYETPPPDAAEEEKELAAAWDHGSDPVNWPPRSVQQEVFRAQIALAKACGLPVVVHSRDAAADTLQILRETNAGDTGCDMHCFGYSKESAREFLNLGCYLGIGGVSTFKNGRKLKEVLEYAPLERLLLETDAPYLTPEPYRGKRNASFYLPYVVEAIAACKGISAEAVMEQTTKNARTLFQRLPGN